MSHWSLVTVCCTFSAGREKQHTCQRERSPLRPCLLVYLSVFIPRSSESILSCCTLVILIPSTGSILASLSALPVVRASGTSHIPSPWFEHLICIILCRAFGAAETKKYDYSDISLSIDLHLDVISSLLRISKSYPGLDLNEL